MSVFLLNQCDIAYYARDVSAVLPDGGEAFALGPQAGALYEDALRQAFNFLRRHDDGRYSSRMKMRVLNAAETAEAARESGLTDQDAPGVVGIRVPFGFDEDTEVKSGGVVAVAVVWPSDNGRTVLAVHGSYRRKHLGSLLIHLLRSPIRLVGMTAWVNKSNTVAQHFLLSTGFNATGFNKSGGVCWTASVNGDHEDGVEDYIDPLQTVSSPLRGRPEPERYYDDDSDYCDDDVESDQCEPALAGWRR